MTAAQRTEGVMRRRISQGAKDDAPVLRLQPIPLSTNRSLLAQT
jgi:hypothetical protein